MVGQIVILNHKIDTLFSHYQIGQISFFVIGQ
jgi:hypothetical protein